MEAINSGMVLKFMIENDQLENIFSVVDEEITVSNNRWIFTGTLLRIGSKKRKDSDGNQEIFKELTILIESITIQEEHYSFPDKKDFFRNTVDIVV